MPTKRIDDDRTRQVKKPCLHPEHRPPSHRVFQPGTWEHTCPGCGEKVVFRVGTALM